ncbi:Thymidine kinase [Pseudarthrobacter chlorophenolicus A6]|uniref:Thymidine kinase n=1 Tax=Pseudarthrobacter chlorophenolicus (strain ATCC 700700 / DSM 12829 / CIP 107037 / JCM 12360 / KCTC 9906 / NCIMB 13794 / A6) TaxID=452863 RepID=B8HH24_PSECP|nr:thymidine kinase [Pseudarthrobacter chlorophenolicus]ACL39613.1 Thymidine kinase [Pseudarthrobacter chlorophenolicus A6]SDQ96552.1 thymidine kinase [Pseudarthrobacter chlorophenolicus]
MAELVFFSGTMDCGKSTLALQMDHNHRARGRGGVRFSRNDRAGESRISSRLGLETDAVEVVDGTDFWEEVMRRRTHGQRVDYLICDEAQFYTPEQVEQLAKVVDEIDVDVFAFGITADFRTRLFPGSQRLIELADRVQVLQVEALCWCGRRATHNARTVDGVMVTEGAQVVVGDVDMAVDGAVAAADHHVPVVGYETLCRRHFMRRVTAHGANLMAEQDQLLPFDVDACLWHGSGGPAAGTGA